MQYRYLAYTLGQGLIKGRLEAPGEPEAREELARLGLKPLRVAPSWHAPRIEDLFPSLLHVGSAELIRFSKGLATMLASGGNLSKALTMLQNEGRNRLMHRTLEAIQATLNDGGSLSAALAEHPSVFSPLFVSVVEVGEQSGRLGAALEQMAEMLEREQQARQRAMRTMLYPMAIIGLAFVTLAVLMTVALPPLLAVFEQLGSEAPLMTRIAIAMAQGLKAGVAPLLLGLGALGVLLWAMRRYPRSRLWLDMAWLRAPLVGPLVLTGELSRLSRTVALLLEAGVSLATALRHGINGSRNLALRRVFSDAETQLVAGHGFASSLAASRLLPTLFVELVAIGEESNSFQRTMRDAANAYEKEFESRVNRLVGLLEPASTLAVGAIVGFIAFSMFVPIYSGLNVFK